MELNECYVQPQKKIVIFIFLVITITGNSYINLVRQLRSSQPAYFPHQKAPHQPSSFHNEIYVQN